MVIYLISELFKTKHYEKLGFKIHNSFTSLANHFQYMELCISSLSFILLILLEDYDAIFFSCNVFMYEIVGISVILVFKYLLL